ncbi:MAG TPA: hypothetical protein VF135_13880 [Terriglobales bacterium]
MATDNITIITKQDPLTPIENRVGLLLESAPDASLPFASAVELRELTGPFEKAKTRAWQLTQKLIDGEPAFEGVEQLHVMEEIIIRALETIFHAIHLDQWLSRHEISECRFRAPSPYIGRLRSIQAVSGSNYRIVAPDATRASVSGKVQRRVQNSGAKGLRESITLGMRRFFPNGARYLASMGVTRSQVRGGCWFYTTAYTFTNIGLAYEPHLPEPLHYLADSSEPGTRPLEERKRPYSDLYAWASWSDLPGQPCLRRLRDDLVSHIKSASLGGDEEVARAALLRTEAFQTYLNRILPLTCFHTRISRNFIEEVRPELIIVGNAAFEGPLLQLARARKIPTVLLQHGILGDYYQLMDQPADTLLVRGEFWREFVAPKMRERTRVLNVPDGLTREQTQKSAGAKILFLTSVDAALIHTHESDLRDILTRLLKVSAATNRALIIRVHPMEPVGYYKNIVEEISSRSGLPPNVEYSQGPGLNENLAQAAVAVTYSSTVFLDCLRLGIPIISFDWHDFAYKELVSRHKVFHFAKSLEELEWLVSEAVAGRISVSTDYEQFLAPTTKDELSEYFRSVSSGAASAKRV